MKGGKFPPKYLPAPNLARDGLVLAGFRSHLSRIANAANVFNIGVAQVFQCLFGNACAVAAAAVEFDGCVFVEVQPGNVGGDGAVGHQGDAFDVVGVPFFLGAHVNPRRIIRQCGEGAEGEDGGQGGDDEELEVFHG